MASFISNQTNKCHTTNLFETLSSKNFENIYSWQFLYPQEMQCASSKLAGFCCSRCWLWLIIVYIFYVKMKWAHLRRWHGCSKSNWHVIISCSKPKHFEFDFVSHHFLFKIMLKCLILWRRSLFQHFSYFRSLTTLI